MSPASVLRRARDEAETSGLPAPAQRVPRPSQACESASSQHVLRRVPSGGAENIPALEVAVSASASRAGSHVLSTDLPRLLIAVSSIKEPALRPLCLAVRCMASYVCRARRACFMALPPFEAREADFSAPVDMLLARATAHYSFASQATRQLTLPGQVAEHQGTHNQIDVVDWIHACHLF